MIQILAESYLHRLDPFVLRFTETFGIRWYGVSYLLGFFIAWLLLRWMARTRRCALEPAAVPDFIIYEIAGILIGGRLGYCIFYDQRLLWDPPLIGIVQVWRGGMASHGGFIGAVAAACLFARRRRVPALHLLDLGALACPIGLGLGRLANFINAELWGKALPAALQRDPPWWSVKYPQEIIPHNFARAGELAALKPLVDERGPLVPAILKAVQDGNERAIDGLRPLLTAHYPSQIFQALTDGPILFAVMAALWLFPLKPGCASGGFLMSYGVLRILTEVFRQPDEGVALLPTPLGDLSRGQVLSLLMVVAGAILTAICARRSDRPAGCLRPSALARKP